MAELGTTAPGAQTGWVRRITRYQWLVFFVVWAGWSLDAADFGLYSLVLAPALRELLGGSPSPADIRRGMVEPERFSAVAERRQALSAKREHTEEDREFMRFVPVQLFSRQNRYNTTVGLLFCVGTLLAIWTSNIWLPTIQRGILAKEGILDNAAIPYISYGMTMWSIGGIFGYAAFGFIADAIGRRPAILIYNIGTLVVGLTLYLAVDTFGPYPFLLFVFGFFVFGVFSGHAVYLPELFPTHVRATAVSFCNGSGRIITSFGPLLAGLLVSRVDLRTATAAMTCCALLSVLGIILGRETRDDELPR